MAGRIPNTGTVEGVARSSTFIGQTPRRGVMIAMDVDPKTDKSRFVPRSMEFFINPDQLDLVTEAVWTKIAIPGLSHEVLQYSHTMSTNINFTVQWSYNEALRRQRSITGQRVNGQVIDNVDDPFADIRELSQSLPFQYRNFLHSFTVPMERGRAPSRCLLLWPNFLALICVINKVEFKFTRWTNRGMPMSWSADLDITEQRTVFKRRNARENYFTQVDLQASHEQDNDLLAVINTSENSHLDRSNIL